MLASKRFLFRLTHETSIGVSPLWRSLRSLSPHEGKQILSLRLPDHCIVPIQFKQIHLLKIMSPTQRKHIIIACPVETVGFPGLKSLESFRFLRVGRYPKGHSAAREKGRRSLQRGKGGRYGGSKDDCAGKCASFPALSLGWACRLSFL